MTFIAALRHDRISAPWVIGGPHQWRTLHALCREGVGAHSGKGRDRDSRQPRQPQRQVGPQRHPRLWRMQVREAGRSSVGAEWVGGTYLERQSPSSPCCGRYLSGAARSCDVRTACQTNLRLWPPSHHQRRSGCRRDQANVAHEPVTTTHWSIRSMAAEAAYLTPRSAECGRRSACSHTVARYSSFRAIRCSRGTRYRRSLPFPRRPEPLSSTSMRKIRSTRSRATGFADDAWRTGARTHRYVRHGTITLFAALNVASGFVTGKMLQASPAGRVLEVTSASQK